MSATESFLERFSRVYPYSHCVWRIPEAAAQASFGPFSAPLLDLGCGDGGYFRMMLEEVGPPKDPKTGQPGPAYGIDPQAWEIDKAKKTGVYRDLFVGTSSKIPLADGSVNMVFSNSVVEHIADKEGTIREVARILAPGGRYLFSAPHKAFETAFPFHRFLVRLLGERLGSRWIGAINAKFIHLWLQTAEEWTRDLEAGGLKVVAVRHTLMPENAAEWERWLVPSYLQHVPAKRLGWVPFSGWSRRRLQRRIAALREPADAAAGGNLVILAEKPAL
jgi:ubiquinone/menaquinone biosynthesis C-methylase UbiE